MADRFLGHRLVAATRFVRWERQLARAMSRALDNQRARALTNLRHAVTASGVPPDPFDEVTWGDQVEAEVAPVARKLLGDVAKGVVDLFDDVDLPLPDLTFRLDRLLGSMRGLGADLSSSLGRTLTDGVAKGEGVDALAARVSDVFDSVGESRARTIARTEVVGAANGAADDAAGAVNASGMELTKTWLATGDDRARDDHAEADGQTVAYDDVFVVGGYELAYPGDPDGEAGQVVNCRCTVIYGDATQAVDTVADDEA